MLSSLSFGASFSFPPLSLITMTSNATNSTLSDHKGPFYVVRAGHKPGIYTNFGEAEQVAVNYPCSQPKKFETLEKAQDYMSQAFNSAPEHWISVLLSDKNSDEHTWVAYTKGACRNNGHAGAKGGVGVYFGELHPCNFSGPLAGSRQTSQRAELGAILKALEIIDSRGETLTWQIRSDSQYAVNCCSQWLEGWKRNDWKNSKGNEVDNQDLIMAIDEYLQKDRTRIGTRVSFKHVTGHAGETECEEVDELATKGVDEPLWKA